MSRQLWCEACGDEENKLEGARMVLQATPQGEPAEYERVVWGKARTPNPAERVMTVNGNPMPLPTAHYICDRCNRAIYPGDRCMTWTIWMEGMAVPRAWEQEYLEAHDRPGSVPA